METVKNIPISEEKRKSFISNIVKIVKNSRARSFFSVREIREEEKSEEFLKLGLSLIMDRIWVTDTDSIHPNERGYDEGSSIEEGEIKLVFDSIFNSMSEDNTLTKNDELKESHIIEALSKLEENSSGCELIFTNIHDVFSFWYMTNFKGVPKTGSERRLEGYYKNIPVYWNRLLPKGITLLINKNVGELVIKRDIDKNASIKDIEDSEKEGIVKNLPQLKDVDIKEKVRLYIDELLKFKILNNKAVILLKTKSEEK